MKIIDVHAHIFPQKVEKSAVRAISEFYFDAPMAHRGTSEALIASGSRIGVERYLVFSAATVPHQVESINTFIMGECAKHPEFMGAGTMHEDYPEPEAEIERICRAGMRGIKLHPDFQHFNVDDPKMDRAYAALEERKMFIIVHTGDRRYDFSHPNRVANVAERFPGLRVIAAHFGGYCQWAVARERLLKLPNVYIDTSSTLGMDGRGEALKTLEMIDPTHVFFATDFPMWDHAEELERVKSLGLSDAMLEDVLYNNFDRFYAGLCR